MHYTRHAVTIETNAAGDGTGYTPIVNGAIVSVQYVKDDFDNGVDFDVTAETTGQVIWDQDNVNASATVCPRQPTHSTLGAAALYAAGGAAVLDKICLDNERVKIVVAQGGNTKGGTFNVTVEGA